MDPSASTPRTRDIEEALRRVSRASRARGERGDSAAVTTVDLRGGVRRVRSRAERSTSLVPINMVSPGFFAALGVPLLAGRDFAETDTASTPGVVDRERELRA